MKSFLSLFTAGAWLLLASVTQAADHGKIFDLDLDASVARLKAGGWAEFQEDDPSFPFEKNLTYRKNGLSADVYWIKGKVAAMNVTIPLDVSNEEWKELLKRIGLPESIKKEDEPKVIEGDGRNLVYYQSGVVFVGLKEDFDKAEDIPNMIAKGSVKTEIAERIFKDVMGPATKDKE